MPSQDGLHTYIRRSGQPFGLLFVNTVYISSAHVVLEKVAHCLKFHSFFTKSQAIHHVLIVMNSILWFLHTENVHLGLPVQTKLYNVAHINANIVTAVTCV